MEQDRGHWTSRLGFVLAAAGSAIGLGNLWKFPYITWDNEGGAFVLVYLLCIAAVGLPCVELRGLDALGLVVTPEHASLVPHGRRTGPR